jgi:hypothetical protein
MELNLPKVSSFLCCGKIRQDVLSKNYDFTGVFQGFNPPGYPFGAEFVTFTRLSHEPSGDFQVDISLYNDKNEKISAGTPRKIQFAAESPNHDLITAWRVVFPSPGTYVFKAFCNNLSVGEYKIYCR